MARVVLVGTFDTKGAEYAYVRDRLVELGCEVTLVDAGVHPPVDVVPDIANHEVYPDVDRLAAQGDRGSAVVAMADATAEVVRRLYAAGELDGLLALGGSGGAHIGGRAAQALPVGVPKLIVTTGSGPGFAETDVTTMYPIVDISGINRISARVLANAAAAMAGMVSASVPRWVGDRPVVAATMFGVTTPCVTEVRKRLEERGYEVLVFHATGAGGRSLEALVRSGLVDGVVDVTTTELADELVGGVCSAGPTRLTAAGETGTPQVVSLGALDMVNFGAPPTVPERFAGRLLHQHTPSATLMRTSVDECVEIGRRMAVRLNAATGPTSVVIPLRGVSAMSVVGAPFRDAAADSALIDALLDGLADPIDVHQVDADINDTTVATKVADLMHEALTRDKEQTTNGT